MPLRRGVIQSPDCSMLREIWARAASWSSIRGGGAIRDGRKTRRAKRTTRSSLLRGVIRDFASVLWAISSRGATAADIQSCYFTPLCTPCERTRECQGEPRREWFALCRETRTASRSKGCSGGGGGGGIRRRLLRGRCWPEWWQRRIFVPLGPA